jgi:pimeloyl-ACP methyl ester carboxylesterase
LASDRHWQSLLRELSWTELMQRWQAQPVLQTSQPLAPHENAFNREILAAVMEVGSLAHQEDFRSTLARPLRPILWITGARDHKFVALAKGLTTDHLQTETFKDAGHRVPWDQPLQFTQRVEKFVLDQQLL